MLAGMDALGRPNASAPLEDTRREAIEEAREQVRLSPYDRAMIPTTGDEHALHAGPAADRPRRAALPYQSGTHAQPKSSALRAIERVAPSAADHRRAAEFVAACATGYAQRLPARAARADASRSVQVPSLCRRCGRRLSAGSSAALLARRSAWSVACSAIAPAVCLARSGRASTPRFPPAIVSALAPALAASCRRWAGRAARKASAAPIRA